MLCIPGLNILLGCIGLLVKQFKGLKVFRYEIFFYGESTTHTLSKLYGEFEKELLLIQGVELGIEPFDIQTVKLAGNDSCFSPLFFFFFIYYFTYVLFLFIQFVGLLHDVGHGPFSHMFERAFLPLVLHGHWYASLQCMLFPSSH